MPARAIPRVILTFLLASLTFAAVASADDVQGVRVTYASPGAAGEAVLGPGAARGIKLIINGIDARAPQRAGTEGVPFEVLDVTLISQSAPDCGDPVFAFEDNEIDCTWAKDCALPFDFVELCIRANTEIFDVDAYFVDGSGEFLAPAEVTLLPGVCDLDCGDAAAVIESIWPPNHKLSPVAITGVTGGVGEVTIVATAVTQDEPANTRGDGNSCPDATIDEDGTAWVRMERSGLGNGRVYVVSFTATDESGAECEGQVEVHVQHDRETPAVNDGQTVNSLEACNSAASTRAAVTDAASLRVVGSSARRAELEFALPSAGRVDVGVFDVAGRKIASIESGVRSAGVHRISWEAAGVAQGVYFVRLRAEGVSVSRTLMIAD